MGHYLSEIEGHYLNQETTVKPTVNARLEHVTRRGDRREADTEMLLNMSEDHVQTLRRALEFQLYRLEAELALESCQKVLRGYVREAIGAEIDRSHALLNATKTHLANRGAGAMKAGDTT